MKNDNETYAGTVLGTTACLPTLETEAGDYEMNISRVGDRNHTDSEACLQFAFSFQEVAGFPRLAQRLEHQIESCSRPAHPVRRDQVLQKEEEPLFAVCERWQTDKESGRSRRIRRETASPREGEEGATAIPGTGFHPAG